LAFEIEKQRSHAESLERRLEAAASAEKSPARPPPSPRPSTPVLPKAPAENCGQSTGSPMQNKARVPRLQPPRSHSRSRGQARGDRHEKSSRSSLGSRSSKCAPQTGTSSVTLPLRPCPPLPTKLSDVSAAELEWGTQLRSSPSTPRGRPVAPCIDDDFALPVAGTGDTGECSTCRSELDSANPSVQAELERYANSTQTQLDTLHSSLEAKVAQLQETLSQRDGQMANLASLLTASNVRLSSLKHEATVKDRMLELFHKEVPLRNEYRDEEVAGLFEKAVTPLAALLSKDRPHRGRSLYA